MSEIGAPRIRATLERARDLLSTEEQELLAEIASQTIINAIGRRTVKFNFDIIWSWIQRMTNYNYRYALDVLNRSLRSFHLFDHNFERERHNPARRFDSIKGGIHVKKMKTALINGLALFYSPDQSATPIVNLFDAGDLKLAGNHILRVKMLQYISLKEVFELNEISNKFVNVFGREYATAIERSLFEMVLKGLIVIVNKSGVPVFGDDFGGHGGIEGYEDIQILTGQIAACGRFHVDELLDDDIYLDEMKYATDFDAKRYERIFERVPEKHPVLRKHSTRRFIKEISKIEERFANHSTTLGIGRDRITQSIKAYDTQKAWEDYFHPRKVTG
jgi:hypothetical protein